MALTRCPDCAHNVSDRALACPHCGRQIRAAFPAGVDYRSTATVFGLPLVHIATGFDPETGRRRIAKGVIAIGDLAIGVVAIGGCSVGGLAIGGASFGVIALGGLAIGVLLALGGTAIGGVALGGAALGVVAIGGGAAGYYALGGGAVGVHALGGNTYDPEAAEFFRQWFGSLVDAFE